MKARQFSTKSSFIKKVLDILTKKPQNVPSQHIDNFIFIHINKTGGSSIEKALGLSLEHKTALEKIEEIGYKKWKNCFSFTVVRNPWDKVVSHYHHRVQTNQTDLGVRPVKFKDWVKLTYRDKDSFYYDKPKMFMPQTDWITDHDGQILVDYICRFENISHDFSYVCGILGKTVSLPHIKASKRDHYTVYYDKETIEIIASWFREDIKRFGYEY